VFFKRIIALKNLATQAYNMTGPYKGWIVLIVFISLVMTAIDAALMLLAIPFAQDLFGGDGDLPQLFSWGKEFYRELNPGNDPIWVVLVLIILMIQVRIVEACQTSLIIWANARIMTFIRLTITDKVLSAQFRLIDRMELGALRQIIASESSRVVQAVSDITRFISRVLAIAAKGLMLIHLSPILTAIFFSLAILFFPIKVFNSRCISRWSQTSIDSALKFMDRLNETLSGIRQVKLQNRQEEFLHGIREQSIIENVNMAKARMLNSWEPAIILVIGLICIVGIIAVNRALEFINLGILIGFLMLTYRTLPDITIAAQAANSILQNQPSVVHTARFFNLGEAQQEAKSGRTVDPNEVDEIRIENVSLSYVKEKQVLNSINFSAKRNEFIAIVGPSGAGKSSILHLLLSMYQPDSGHIFIGKHDIADVSPTSLRDCVGLVSQDVHVFNNSIRETIRAGDSSVSDDDVVVAAREAEADAFIKSLPNGYDTIVGERGGRLSGGQRQRVFLAQILARGTPVIVLDEATSSLDNDTSDRVLQSLEKLRPNKILIVITHKIDQIRNADRIYYLKDGQISASGTYDHLTTTNDGFKNLVAAAPHDVPRNTKNTEPRNTR
jgi:ATP-binding cassette, subfamily B, multidrug efflux pump